MKTTLTAIMITVFLLTPALCFSAYRIHLKNGREFVTDRYWEEGDQIKFERFGGEVGIPKNLVSEIEEVEDIPEQQETAEPDTPAKGEASQDGGETDKQAVTEDSVKADASRGKEAKEETEKQTEKEEATENGKQLGEKKEQKIDVAYYQKRKKALLEKKRKVMRRYKTAKEIGDNADRMEARKELKETYKKLSELAVALRKENGGKLPAWWYQINAGTEKMQD
jgi:hypothetical protein